MHYCRFFVMWMMSLFKYLNVTMTQDLGQVEEVLRECGKVVPCLLINPEGAFVGLRSCLPLQFSPQSGFRSSRVMMEEKKLKRIHGGAT